MISHNFKSIFIHIPRCAGTSVETWLCRQDWWSVQPSTKHLLASQARNVYADWWDEYFKFSIVRDPYARTLSLLKYRDHFGLRKDPGNPIDFSGYEHFFGRECVLEHDYRFARREDLLSTKHRPGRIYGNILDEPLDYIGRFESLTDDMAIVRDRIGFPTKFDQHVERSTIAAEETLTLEDRSWITTRYAEDFAAFAYAVEP